VAERGTLGKRQGKSFSKLLLRGKEKGKVKSEKKDLKKKTADKSPKKGWRVHGGLKPGGKQRNGKTVREA